MSLVHGVRRTLLSRKPSPAAALGYTAHGVNFNGSTYFTGTANTAFTGAAVSKKGTYSFWFRMQGGDGNYQILFENAANTGPSIQRDNGNHWNGGGYTSGVVPVAALSTSSTFIASGSTWHHCYATFDETGAPSGVGDILIDGVSRIGGFTQNIGNIDYAAASTLTLGGRNGGSLLMNADIADLYINYGTYLDPATNLTKFRNAGTGKPVDLGSDGSTPTGTAPIGYFSGAVATWHVNKGSGGNLFTLTAGGLTASSSNP